ncbi:sortase domain-bontaining protein [Streptomyces celluloflavus]|uniref:sortase domain-containing protein n=1 Tax=Streptomyces celluloflavus TaxID=58344 RepID=UPI0037B83EED
MENPATRRRLRGKPVRVLGERPPGRSSPRADRRVNTIAALLLAGSAATLAWTLLSGHDTVRAVVMAGTAAGHTPVALDIPKAGVHAPLMRLGRNADGTVQTPDAGQGAYAGWYDRSAPPGDNGTAVIVGHHATRYGHAVFHNLRALGRGDLIDVTRADGSHRTFAVQRKEQVAGSALPGERGYVNSRGPTLRLITCAGVPEAARHPAGDLVVYAVPGGARR